MVPVTAVNCSKGTFKTVKKPRTAKGAIAERTTLTKKIATRIEYIAGGEGRRREKGGNHSHVSPARPGHNWEMSSPCVTP